MRRVKCTDAQGHSIIFKGKAKAARHFTLAFGQTITPKRVQQAVDGINDIPGFQLSWAVPGDVRQHARDFAAGAGKEEGGEDDMQDGAISVLNAPTR